VPAYGGPNFLSSHLPGCAHRFCRRRALSGLPSSPRTRPDRKGFALIWPLGEVAEWLNAPHSKCGIGASLSGVRIPPSPPYPIDSNNVIWFYAPGLALNVCAISFASLSSRHEIRRADQLAQVDPMRVVKLDIRASKSDSRRESGVNLELKSFARRGASA
jgi:hypothetical protein